MRHKAASTAAKCTHVQSKAVLAQDTQGRSHRSQHTTLKVSVARALHCIADANGGSGVSNGGSGVSNGGSNGEAHTDLSRTYAAGSSGNASLDSIPASKRNESSQAKQKPKSKA
jgi:hypothetical protein